MKIKVNDANFSIDSVSTSNMSYVDANFSSCFPYNKLRDTVNQIGTSIIGRLYVTDEILPSIRDVKFFNNKTTVVWWNDGSKTVVVCQDGDTFDKEKGLAMAIVKRAYGNKGNFNNVFRKFIYDKE